MYSLHFTADDYNVGMKHKLLLPTALHTQFMGYPTYMLLFRAQQRRTLLRAPPNPCTQVRISGEPALVAEKNKAEHPRLVEPDAERAASGYQKQENIASDKSADGR